MVKKEFISDGDVRLDIFLSEQLNESRNQIEQLIKKGYVEVENKSKAKSGLKLVLGQKVVVSFPSVVQEEALKVDFDVPVVYEDEYLMVLNKPSSVVVHGAPSVKEATLVDWLKKRDISLSTISGEERHGIVHRLDKGTSGLIVIAKTNEAHIQLSKQLEDKSMGRYYLALIDLPLKENVEVQKPIARNPNNRLKMGIVPNGKYAKTQFLKLSLSKNEKQELIAAKLFTGRTHQIRVHLESLSRHILGDDLYGFKCTNDKIERIYLHAFSLYFKHPITEELMCFNASLPDEIGEYLEKHFIKEDYNEKINSEYISSKFITSF